MNERRAAVLRGLARQIEAIVASADPERRNRWMEELATETLDGVGSYKLSAALMAFAQGPLQRQFVTRYTDDIAADGDRLVLRLFDDPETRTQAVGMAVQTGRMIVLDSEGTHWEFKEADTPLELLQWSTRQGVRPMDALQGLPMQFLQGTLGRAVVEASRHPEEPPEEEGDDPRDGNYL
jgi:hypothetical protein